MAETDLFTTQDPRANANRDDLDVGLIRREWAPYAASEADRTAWLESAIARLAPNRGQS